MKLMESQIVPEADGLWTMFYIIFIGDNAPFSRYFEFPEDCGLGYMIEFLHNTIDASSLRSAHTIILVRFLDTTGLRYY